MQGVSIPKPCIVQGQLYFPYFTFLEILKGCKEDEIGISTKPLLGIRSLTSTDTEIFRIPPLIENWEGEEKWMNR